MPDSLARKFSVVAVLALCPLLAEASMLTQGDVIQLRRYANGSYETYGAASGGGEFAIFKKVGTDYEFLAKTFCLEYDEHIRLNRDFLVGGVSDRAVLGGANETNGDVISLAVDFLYSAFHTETLDSFNLELNSSDPQQFYDPTSDVWANALQRAIWKLEGERSTFGDSSYSDEAKLLHDFALDHTSSWSGNSGNVKALNLFEVGTNLTGFDPLDPATYIDDDIGVGRTRSTHKQDQLWYVSNSGTGGPGSPNNPVPEPGTLLIWSAFGVGGLISSRRRRRHGTSNPQIGKLFFPRS